MCETARNHRPLSQTNVVNSWIEWDPLQAEKPTMDLLRSLGCEVIPCPFDRVYAFGSGFHCCTADIRRDGTLESYFPTLDQWR